MRWPETKPNSFGGRLSRPLECWAGSDRTHRPEETLENIEFSQSSAACRRGRYLAPLSVSRSRRPCALSWPARSPIYSTALEPPNSTLYLYDNADIAADPQGSSHPHAHQVKAHVAPGFRSRHQGFGFAKDFGQLHEGGSRASASGANLAIYVGNAKLDLRSLSPAHGRFRGTVTEHWNRYRLRGSLPTRALSRAPRTRCLEGVGPRAWQVCRAGDCGTHGRGSRSGGQLSRTATFATGRTSTYDRLPQARRCYAIGRRLRARRWPKGNARPTRPRRLRVASTRPFSMRSRTRAGDPDRMRPG